MLSLHSPAKINWFLKVIGKRPDGYHSIYSVMQTINLTDALLFEKRSEGIEVESDIGIPLEHNLVYKAASRLKEYTGSPSGARIRLIKKIPLEAGLGGGSSNAAATLKGLNILWGTGLAPDELIRIGTEIGSDVPFFLDGSIALVEGRGERITPLSISPGGINLLIVKPGVGVPTETAYKNLTSYSNNDATLKERLLKILISGNIKGLHEVMSNDLEGPVFKLFPVLEDIKDRLLSKGASAALLSGSGSSLFGVFPAKEEATKASDSFKDLWHVVTETI